MPSNKKKPTTRTRKKAPTRKSTARKSTLKKPAARKATAKKATAKKATAKKADGEEGHGEEGHDEEGHDEEGHDEEGHDEEGHDEEGHDEEGPSEEAHDEEGPSEEVHGEEAGRASTGPTRRPHRSGLRARRYATARGRGAEGHPWRRERELPGQVGGRARDLHHAGGRNGHDRPDIGTHHTDAAWSSGRGDEGLRTTVVRPARWELRGRLHVPVARSRPACIPGRARAHTRRSSPRSRLRDRRRIAGRSGDRGVGGRRRSLTGDDPGGGRSCRRHRERSVRDRGRRAPGLRGRSLHGGPVFKRLPSLPGSIPSGGGDATRPRGRWTARDRRRLRGSPDGPYR